MPSCDRCRHRLTPHDVDTGRPTTHCHADVPLLEVRLLTEREDVQRDFRVPGYTEARTRIYQTGIAGDHCESYTTDGPQGSTYPPRPDYPFRGLSVQSPLAGTEDAVRYAIQQALPAGVALSGLSFDLSAPGALDIKVTLQGAKYQTTIPISLSKSKPSPTRYERILADEF